MSTTLKGMSASGSVNYQLAQPPVLCLTVLLCIKIKGSDVVWQSASGNREANTEAREGPVGSCHSLLWDFVNILAGKEWELVGATGMDREAAEDSLGWQEIIQIPDLLLPPICVFQPTESTTYYQLQNQLPNNYRNSHMIKMQYKISTYTKELKHVTKYHLDPKNLWNKKSLLKHNRL